MAFLRGQHLVHTHLWKPFITAGCLTHLDLPWLRKFQRLLRQLQSGGVRKQFQLGENGGWIRNRSLILVVGCSFLFGCRIMCFQAHHKDMIATRRIELAILLLASSNCVSISMGLSGPKNAGIAAYMAMFLWHMPLHSLFIGLVYGRYLQLRYLKWLQLWPEIPVTNPIKLECTSCNWNHQL